MASTRSQEDLGKYRCKFTKISSHLVDTGKLSETEWNDLFLQGFPKEVEERIHHWLSITKFDLHPDDPYPMADVLTTVKFLLTGSAYRSALPDLLSAHDQRDLAGYPLPYVLAYQPATQLPVPPVSTSGSAPMKAEYGMTGQQEILCAFCGGPGHYASQCEICEQYIAVNCAIRGMDGRMYLPGGRRIPCIPGCKCIQACIDQVEAENAAASQAIVAASTSVPRESTEQSTLDPLPHTTVGILSVAEPVDATYEVSSSAEMANPDFQPYLAKAWAAYQAAKQSNDAPPREVMTHDVSWANQIHPPKVPDSTGFNPPSTSMPSLAVPNANVCSSHTVQLSSDPMNESASGRILEPPSVVVPIWDLIAAVPDLQEQFCDVAAVRRTSPPIDMVQSIGGLDTTQSFNCFVTTISDKHLGSDQTLTPYIEDPEETFCSSIVPSNLGDDVSESLSSPGDLSFASCYPLSQSTTSSLPFESSCSQTQSGLQSASTSVLLLCSATDQPTSFVLSCVLDCNLPLNIQIVDQDPLVYLHSIYFLPPIRPIVKFDPTLLSLLLVNQPVDPKVFSILGESLQEYQVIKHLPHNPPTGLEPLPTNYQSPDPYITHQCKDPCFLHPLPDEIAKSPVSPSLACGFFLSQEAHIQTSPQGFLHHMICYPFYPGLRPVNLCFTLGLDQRSHSQSVSSRFSPGVLIHLSNQTKNKTKNPLCYRKNKPSSMSPALSYPLYPFFEQNKNKGPFVSQSLPTTFRLRPCAETLHPLVKSYNPLTIRWTRVQSEKKNHLSSSFSHLNICSFHVFGLMLINPSLMYRPQQFRLTMNRTGLKWTPTDSLGFTWDDLDTIGLFYIQVTGSELLYMSAKPSFISANFSSIPATSDSIPHIRPRIEWMSTSIARIHPTVLCIVDSSATTCAHVTGFPVEPMWTGMVTTRLLRPLLGPGSLSSETSIVSCVDAFLCILGAGLADDLSACVNLNPVTTYLAPSPSPLLCHPSLHVRWTCCTCPSTSGMRCTSGWAARCTLSSYSHTFRMVACARLPCCYPPRLALPPEGAEHSVSITQSAVNPLTLRRTGITTSMLRVDPCADGDEAGIALIMQNSIRFTGAGFTVGFATGVSSFSSSASRARLASSSKRRTASLLMSSSLSERAGSLPLRNASSSSVLRAVDSSFALQSPSHFTCIPSTSLSAFFTSSGTDTSTLSSAASWSVPSSSLWAVISIRL